MTIYFLKAWKNYAKGELAVVTPKRAQWLMDKGYAVLHRTMSESSYVSR